MSEQSSSSVPTNMPRRYVGYIYVASERSIAVSLVHERANQTNETEIQVPGSSRLDDAVATVDTDLSPSHES